MRGIILHLAGGAVLDLIAALARWRVRVETAVLVQLVAGGAGELVQGVGQRQLAAIIVEKGVFQAELEAIGLALEHGGKPVRGVTLR